MKANIQSLPDCFIPIIRNDSPLSVCGVLSIGRTKAGELIKSSDFPRPVNLGGRCVRYRLSEVLAWAEAHRLDAVPVATDVAA